MRRFFTAALVCGLLLLVACASPIDRANELSGAGRGEEALDLLEQAILAAPTDAGLRAAALRQRSRLAQQWLVRAESARNAGRPDDARRLAERALQLDPTLPRADSLLRDIARGAQQAREVAQASDALAAGQWDRAEALARRVLADDPGQPAAAALLQRIADARPRPAAAETLGAAFRKPVSLELRDAPLRTVFELLSQASGLGFVFDRDVRGDSKVTLFLRDTTVDEALRIVSATQQLESKRLNDSTLLIYPNTPAKLREHQDLVTRAFYLANADVKQAQAMVRTLAKSRDVHVDERLNLLLVRDTPEVIRMVEKLMATIDLPDPEVVLDVEVMEIGSDRLNSLGLQWPDSISFGLPGVGDGSAGPSQVPLNQIHSFRGLVANPAVVASLTANNGSTNLIANPSIRVRSRDKAKILIGDKLPVFTTTATANVGVSASVSYLDVGLKLDIEPTVLPANEVIIKLALEVSNLIKEVGGPSGSLAYQVGTRSATTSLRLKDGETQILAGLINDEDRRRAVGVPGLSTVPVLGALFGVQSDAHNKTEVVLMITPRVVRNLATPTGAGLLMDAGNEANPGAAPLRLRAAAKTGVALSDGAPGPAATSSVSPAPAARRDGALRLSGSGTGNVGDSVSVTLYNDSAFNVKGDLLFDARLLQPASAGAGDDGHAPFDLAPRAERVLILRVLPAAAGQVTSVRVSGASARRPDGAAADLAVDGEATIDVAAE
jgi:general secretion pathway protein D